MAKKWIFALRLGFFAGLFFGGVKNFLYYLEFTKVEPLFLLKALYRPAFVMSWIGHLTGWGVFILFSIIVALVYTTLFIRIKGSWMGLAYGAILWVLLYGWLGPALGMMKWLDKLDMNTIVTDFCLFLVWGLFIGYSIAYEFNDVRANEPAP